MKEPEKLPLNPNTPKTKSVKTIPMPQLYIDTMYNDTFKKEDLININNNEDTEKSTET